MFETATNIIILALAIEAVIFVVVLMAYIGTLTQKNMKEAEAAEAQIAAWNSSMELSVALKANMEETKKASIEALRVAMNEALRVAMNEALRVAMNEAITRDEFLKAATTH